MANELKKELLDDEMVMNISGGALKIVSQDGKTWTIWSTHTPNEVYTFPRDKFGDVNAAYNNALNKADDAAILQSLLAQGVIQPV